MFARYFTIKFWLSLIIFLCSFSTHASILELARLHRAEVSLATEAERRSSVAVKATAVYNHPSVESNFEDKSWIPKSYAVWAWRLDEFLDFKIVANCYIFYGQFDWPSDFGCSKELVVGVSKFQVFDSYNNSLKDTWDELDRSLANPRLPLDSHFSDRLKARSEFYATLTESLNGRDWRLSLNMHGTDSQIMEGLMQNGGAIKVNGKTYILDGYADVISKWLSYPESRIEQDVEEMRSRRMQEYWAVAGLVIVGLTASFFAYRFGKKGLKKLKTKREQQKIDAVALDESIRTMARNAVSQESAKSKDVLVAELRKAIESGNHDLANALELALKKA